MGGRTDRGKTVYPPPVELGYKNINIILTGPETKQKISTLYESQ
jgi:hypothetical protein